MRRKWGLICMMALPAWSQSVISVYSGVVNYAEGTVFVDDRPLESKPGRFEEIKPGSELRVEEGRAEVLLTPGVFLRAGAGSAIRMISNLLVDTQVEIVRGPAIIDAAEPTPQTSVTMVLRDHHVHISKAGRYRFDSLPPELRVTDGEAEVSGYGDKPMVVTSGHILHLLSGVTMSDYQLADDLDNWDRDRSEAIARSTEQISNTPEIASLVDAAQNDPLLSDPALAGAGLANLGSYGANPGPYYPPSGGISPYGYGSPSPYSYPYSLYSYGLYSNSLYPYSLYPYGAYPYSLYMPGTIIVPTYRYGIGTRPTVGIGLGSLLNGYRGYTGTSSIHTPIYRPSTPIRTTPSAIPARPAHIGGHR
jgi:hypothetical protein